MGISTSNADLFRAILAMDAYNRGYNAGLKSPNAGPDQGLTGSMIGLASVGTASSSTLNSPERNASFFAQAYTLGGKTIISYRGTDVLPGTAGNPLYGLASWTDVLEWRQFVGAYDTSQQRLAADFVFLNGPKNGHSADTSKSPAGESQAGPCIRY